MFGGFDVTPYVIVATGGFAIGCLVWWAVWELVRAPILEDQQVEILDDLFGVPEFEDTGDVLRALAALNRETA